jgi:hypothetical protein
MAEEVCFMGRLRKWVLRGAPLYRSALGGG